MLVGVDWGGTKIEVVALTPDGTELVREREDTPRGDYAGCLAVIASLVTRVASAVGPVERVGVGIPGSMDPETGLGKGASSTWIMGQPIEDDLRRVLGADVRVVNDVDALAASEARDGAGAGYHVVFTANLASGVGGGLAVGGRAHHGPNNNAADWGHNPLPWASEDELPGPSCWCGLRGCIETWLSGRAFEGQYEAATGEWRHGSEVVELARGGDPVAEGLLERYIDRLGRGLATMVNAIDPDIIILGGGMSNVDEIYAQVPLVVGTYAFSSVFRTPIVKALHGDSSGVRGAAWLWADA